MSLWKFLLIGMVVFTVLALPAFYYISGMLTWDILWNAGLPVIIALVIVYFLFFNKKSGKKAQLFSCIKPV